jgi:hypothetical protein
MSEYNYHTFKYKYYDFNKFSEDPVPNIGDTAIDITLYNLEGRPVQLTDYKGKIIVLESSSITCPMYIQNINAMQNIMNNFPQVIFILLYVREAHPGGKIFAHDSMETKIKRAKKMLNEEEENRILLIDDLDGTAHQIYGSLPNSIFIIDQNFKIVYKADWARPKAVRKVLQQLIDNIQFESMYRPKPSLRPPTPRTMYRVFKRAGWKSFVDFVIKSNIKIPLTFIKLKRKWRKQIKAGIYSN